MLHRKGQCGEAQFCFVVQRLLAGTWNNVARVSRAKSAVGI
jgi:hypothetical protein